MSGKDAHGPFGPSKSVGGGESDADEATPVVVQRHLPRPHASPGELGAIAQKSRTDILSALDIPKLGRLYDLDSGRWPGMPVFPAHPPFILTSYRTPRGMRTMKDLGDWLGTNTVNMGMNTEIIIGTAHTGTHLDALSHITCGTDSQWHDGATEADLLGDFGPLSSEMSSVMPFVCRGVLIDVPRYLGVQALERGRRITLDEMTRTLDYQGTVVREGDAVLFRTGYMQYWGSDDEAAADHFGAGIDHAVAEAMAEHAVVLVGADTESLEVNPSIEPDNPHPVHIELLIKRGIHILELAYLEQLAADRIWEFLFVCLPLRIIGATGSMVRPIAIV